ncbi:alpha-mannosidase [Brachionus plicatilis]|uniref:mannosyl-oligosaccharide 1,3-1,6-alpha-mannosidase n=1 Tax=Brachionus plicatilis TaxID=10195 RepID=A0A3M7SRR1_BRAPC|nr:alpha-mannosidase [Brachionus plicatilis]
MRYQTKESELIIVRPNFEIKVKFNLTNYHSIFNRSHDLIIYQLIMSKFRYINRIFRIIYLNKKYGFLFMAQSFLILFFLLKSLEDSQNDSERFLKKKNFLQNRIYPKQCYWFREQKVSSDFNVSELIRTLPFDSGSVVSKAYSSSEWTSDKKLNVIIVPHSHNDPGWLMTFEQYFYNLTNSILDTVVNSLSEKSTRRFIWAEISYLSLWWSRASEEMRSKMKRLIVDTKQLEIVTDPSIRPNYGWSIDPFGYSPTMAYLLKQMGFDSMLLQRVHYHLKKYLAENQRFEFLWKQSWSSVKDKDTSILCHVMPYGHYDVPSTCGPDSYVCCQFDFMRIPRGIRCPGSQPRLVTKSNIKHQAELLLDQYRKKSQLYGNKDNHNVVFVPLGDDFTYSKLIHAQVQFENYEKIIEYINSKEEFKAYIRFGTLREYFEALMKNNKKFNVNMPSFKGDFFTYADSSNNYWSGYFTSRPFYKRLDRLVGFYLRSAEILFSLNNLIGDTKQSKINFLFKKLIVARQNLAIFQHHDGITGTSKTYVVQDYANKHYIFKSIGYTSLPGSWLIKQINKVFTINFQYLKTTSLKYNKKLYHKKDKMKSEI